LVDDRLELVDRLGADEAAAVDEEVRGAVGLEVVAQVLVLGDLLLVLVLRDGALHLGGVEAERLTVLEEVVVVELGLVVGPLAAAALAARLVLRVGLARALLVPEQIVRRPEALVALLGLRLEGELRGGLGAVVERERVVLPDDADLVPVGLA